MSGRGAPLLRVLTPVPAVTAPAAARNHNRVGFDARANAGEGDAGARARPHDGAGDGDEALLAACARGDTGALGLLFDRYDRSVRGFLARACQVPFSDLDDLVHATFLEVYRSAATFGGRASARTWIIGIAINVSRHHARSEARRRRFLVALAGVPAAPGVATQAAIEHRQALDRLATAIGELPYARRAAFVLCEIEGLSAAEAAEVLGTRVGTLGRWLHEARKELRAAVAGAVEWTSP